MFEQTLNLRLKYQIKSFKAYFPLKKNLEMHFKNKTKKYLWYRMKTYDSELKQGCENWKY